MGCEVKELNVQSDHIHLLVSMPPKESVSKLMGTVKGKTAIQIFRQFPYLKHKPYWGNHFWARGYCVDTVGIDEEVIRKYDKILGCKRPSFKTIRAADCSLRRHSYP